MRFVIIKRILGHSEKLKCRVFHIPPFLLLGLNLFIATTACVQCRCKCVVVARDDDDNDGIEDDNVAVGDDDDGGVGDDDDSGVNVFQVLQFKQC